MGTTQNGAKVERLKAGSPPKLSRKCHPERSPKGEVEGSAVWMMAEANRRSFDSSSRDEAARSSAQDDTFVGNYMATHPNRLQ
jgi:hypothetical protein